MNDEAKAAGGRSTQEDKDSSTLIETNGHVGKVGNMADYSPESHSSNNNHHTKSSDHAAPSWGNGDRDWADDSLTGSAPGTRELGRVMLDGASPDELKGTPWRYDGQRPIMRLVGEAADRFVAELAYAVEEVNDA